MCNISYTEYLQRKYERVKKCFFPHFKMCHLNAQSKLWTVFYVSNFSTAILNLTRDSKIRLKYFCICGALCSYIRAMDC